MQYMDVCAYPFDALAATKEPIVIDTETIGHTRESNIVFYYSWASNDPAVGSGGGPLTTEKGVAFLKALCASKVPKICHNLKADLTFLEKTNIQLLPPYHDTILMHALVSPGRMKEHGLKLLSVQLLHQSREDAHELQQVQQRVPKPVRNMLTPQAILHRYAVIDAQDTLQIFNLLWPQLQELGLEQIYKIELAATLCYSLIDKRGIGFDSLVAAHTIRELEEALAHIRIRMHKEFGTEFNPASPKQLQEVLLKRIPLKERTKKGNLKTDVKTLQPLRHDPGVQLLLAWKFLNSARRQLNMYNSGVMADGRIHPDYHTLTITGRAGCSGYNLMNIPKLRGYVSELDVGDAQLAGLASKAFRTIRRCFCVKDSAYRLVSTDYSQIEYRVLAHYMQVARLIQMLHRGEDFHTATSKMIFNEASDYLRQITKIINYGKIYGMTSLATLDKQLRVTKITRTAAEVMAEYDTKLPEVKQFQERTIRVALEQGYLQDLFGRYYTILPEEAQTTAVAYLCQGTAATLKKISLVRITNLLQKETNNRSGVVADIHDDLVLELHRDDVHLLPQLVAEATRYPQISVPIVVDVAIGKNLLETVKCKDLTKAHEAWSN